ncbi:hypothetical protein GOODEAATRI_021612 [Goodea atripinnis]|uniref:Uncharacterized protein n=1 Tax=Goodea atripinnis TaxID=208336 RepID=A0ABV0NWK5_9TELE
MLKATKASANREVLMDPDSSVFGEVSNCRVDDLLSDLRTTVAMASSMSADLLSLFSLIVRCSGNCQKQTAPLVMPTLPSGVCSRHVSSLYPLIYMWFMLHPKQFPQEGQVCLSLLSQALTS